MTRVQQLLATTGADRRRFMLRAARDYFLCLRAGLIDRNTRANRRAFCAGYAAMDEFYRHEPLGTLRHLSARIDGSNAVSYCPSTRSHQANNEKSGAGSVPLFFAFREESLR